jgi:hypothetical protein
LEKVHELSERKEDCRCRRRPRMRHDVVHRLERPRRNFAAGRQGASGDAIIRHSLFRGHYYTNDGLPWYAVRAYYFGGPWSYGYSGWTDYAARNGIGCVPGSLVKGGEGIMYVCQ